MADINKIRQEIPVIEKELNDLEKIINDLHSKIKIETTKYGTNQKANQELAKRIDGLEKSLKENQAKYDNLFNKLSGLVEELENAGKQSPGNSNNQKTR